MFAAEKGWDIEEHNYLDNLLQGNFMKKRETKQCIVNSHRIRTLSQPKIAPVSVQSYRKHLNSRLSIQASKMNLQFNFVVLDEVLQRKKSNHLSQISISPQKQTQQNSQRKPGCKIINMSNLLISSPNSQQLNKVLRRVYK